MSVVGLAKAVEAPLGGRLPRLLLAPRGDAGVDVPADVVGTRSALLRAHLTVGGPHIVLDADHAARCPSRRHVDSVADSATATHPTDAECVADVLRVPTHPALVWEHANRAIQHRFEPP